MYPQNCWILLSDCSTAFIKQVFPRFLNPALPLDFNNLLWLLLMLKLAPPLTVLNVPLALRGGTTTLAVGAVGDGRVVAELVEGVEDVFPAFLRTSEDRTPLLPLLRAPCFEWLWFLSLIFLGEDDDDDDDDDVAVNFSFFVPSLASPLVVVIFVVAVETDRLGLFTPFPIRTSLYEVEPTRLADRAAPTMEDGGTAP